MNRVLAVLFFLCLLFFGTYFAKVSHGGAGSVWLGYVLGAAAFIFAPMIWKSRIGNQRSAVPPDQEVIAPVSVATPSIVPPSVATPRIVAPSDANHRIVTEEDETLYLQAAKEFDGGGRRQGLWVKVTLTETDPVRQRAAYVEHRVAQLRANSKVAKAQCEKTRKRQAFSQWWHARCGRWSTSFMIIVLLIVYPIGALVALWALITAARIWLFNSKATFKD